MVSLEYAGEQNIALCSQIIEEGRQFQQEQGFTQWTEDYPNVDTIRADVKEQKAYVVKVDGVIAGYLCIDFAGEPAYKVIDGAWRAEGDYAAVHRMAFRPQFRGIGLTESVFQLIDGLCREKGIYMIRMDTDFPNLRMQHVLTKNGFQQCGVVVFQGSGKLAFDKLLS